MTEDNQEQPVEVVVNDTKYILPAGTSEEAKTKFVSDLQDTIRDGAEYVIPDEIGVVFNAGKKGTTDKERIQMMQAEQEALKKKIEEQEKAIADIKPKEDAGEEDKGTEEGDDSGTEDAGEGEKDGDDKGGEADADAGKKEE